MALFVTLVNEFQPFINVKKISTLDVAVVELQNVVLAF